MIYEPIPVGEVTEIHPDDADFEWNKAMLTSQMVDTNSPAYSDWSKKNSRPAWLIHESR